ncbi:MAG: DUF4126 domain-containing protein [Pyrinomonadaceae bacterium]|nr:DUF4126 domain-containing protein [Pyrinomonadaceae bacterium]MDQ3585747.1 DUF4126 domain-containing protein [Acidobacteriota bacterium]
MNLIEILGLGFGAAWTSGINLYATVAVLGLLQRYEIAHLPGGLQVLDNPWIIGVALFLYVIEFVADKVPYVDSVWDALHTFIRVPAGALLAFAATTGMELSPAVQIVAFLIGGSLALSTHGTKATVRAAANTSPEPFSNWGLSLAEDVIAVGAIILAVMHPAIIIGVIIIFLLLLVWILPKVIRALRRLFRSAQNFFQGRRVPAHL